MQSVELQSEVERYREATGGKQVSPNKIDLADGAELLVAVPGEAYPRDFTSSNGARAAADHCDTQYSGWFCAYSKSGYQGTVLQWYRCDTYTVPFGSGGSWINDQTKGQIARMYSPAGNLIFTTYAYDSDVSGNWLPVHTVKLC
ncbi:hypothetical protein [Streptomyces sp. NPDC088736]|uniref:hypothetical protein n=1 Tax=Streptomyces sp. NPDC088736 TaxID=3365881 RepID=UPI00381F7476